MAIYAISDLHLSKAVDKPMDVFGGEWENYMDKLEENWIKTVATEDWVLVCGDLSWATYLVEATADFVFAFFAREKDTVQETTTTGGQRKIR